MVLISDLWAPDTVHGIFAALMKSRVIVSPWLAGINNHTFATAVSQQLDIQAKELIYSRWSDTQKFHLFESAPVSDRFIRTAIYETLAATSLHVAHETVGKLEVTQETLAQTWDILTAFILEHGLEALLTAYTTVIGFENYQALAYYESIPESVFVSGEWHRPWIDYHIEDELLMALALMQVKVGLVDDMRVVQLTPRGQSQYGAISNILNDTGYLKQRVRMLQISQFNLFDEFDKYVARMTPGFHLARERFLDWTGVQPDMRVVELGCASGSFTFNSGLAKRVGRGGEVVGIDPSPAMLHLAEERRRRLNATWVRFIQAKAEDMPLPSDSFDVCFGVSFLHFTDIHLAVTEMTRVTKPGGVVASMHPHTMSFDAPFFRDWFAPLFDLAAKRSEAPRSYLPGREEIEDVFNRHLDQVEGELFEVPFLFHVPDDVIRGFIEGVGLFQEELAVLPWRARREMIQDLKSRGDKICRTYPKEELVLNFAFHRVRGVVREG